MPSACRLVEQRNERTYLPSGSQLDAVSINVHKGGTAARLVLRALEKNGAGFGDVARKAAYDAKRRFRTKHDFFFRQARMAAGALFR